MPNHVTHRMTITGPEADVAACLARHVIVEDGRDGIDFQTIIPMPPSILATCGDKEAGRWETTSNGHQRPGDAQVEAAAVALVTKSNMFTAMTPEQLARIGAPHNVRSAAQAVAWMEKHKPAMLHWGRLSCAAVAETGHAGWYDWSIANWGTKWGAYSYRQHERSEGRVVVLFETAWSTPTPVLRKLSEMWPTLRFDVLAFDEGWCFGARGHLVAGDASAYDVRKELATDELYEAVYGRPVEKDEEDDGASAEVSP